MEHGLFRSIDAFKLIVTVSYRGLNCSATHKSDLKVFVSALNESDIEGSYFFMVRCRDESHVVQ